MRAPLWLWFSFATKQSLVSDQGPLDLLDLVNRRYPFLRVLV